MLEIMISIYLLGWMKFFLFLCLLIYFDYTSNPFPKSYKLSYKTYRIGKDVGLSAFVSFFWPIVLIIEVMLTFYDI